MNSVHNFFSSIISRTIEEIVLLQQLFLYPSEILIKFLWNYYQMFMNKNEIQKLAFIFVSRRR